MFSFFALALTCLSAITSSQATPITRDVAPLEFTMALPEYFCANSRQTLYWRGGSGTYDVTSTLHYQGLPEDNDKVSIIVWSVDSI